MRIKKLVKSVTITVSPREYLKRGIVACEEEALDKLHAIAAEREWEDIHILFDNEDEKIIYTMTRG